MHAEKKEEKKKAAFKIKSRGTDMRSTWNMRQAAETFTWGGQVLTQKTNADRHLNSLRWDVLALELLHR